MLTQLEQLQSDVILSLEDLKAIDLTTLDVAKFSSMMERIIICTGRSNRHVQSLAENLIKDMKHKSSQPLSVTGLESGEWVLVDLGAIVVHVMLPEKRELYQLEKLWSMPNIEPISREE